MLAWFRNVANSDWFSTLILLVILASAVLIGLETYPDLEKQYGNWFWLGEVAVMSFFVAEIVIKLSAEWPRPWRFFQEGWNVFDFIIISICLFPFVSNVVAVVRLARVMRALRLVSLLPGLQLLVGAMLRSLPNMSYVGLLLFLQFYMYAVIGTFLFRKTDPVHFGTLPASMLTLFEVVTLEGWVEIMNNQLYSELDGEKFQSATSRSLQHTIMVVTYFISFIVLGVMIILNLCIGIILRSMEEAQNEVERRRRKEHKQQFGHITLEDELALLEHKLEDLQHQVRRLRSWK